MGKVLIVSRTKMRSGICVGGIDIDKKKFVRLHTDHGANLSEEAPYAIGGLWEMTLESPWNPRKAPHAEDMMVKGASFVSDLPKTMLAEVIRQTGVPIINGPLEETFDRCLKFTSNGKGYINEQNVPSNSVTLWVTDDDIIPVLEFSKTIFRYKDKRMPFVGFQDTQKINSGTLVRLSLANWWKPEDAEVESRCYLQLSGWY